MTTVSATGRKKRAGGTNEPHLVTHDSFQAADAEAVFGPDGGVRDDFAASYMPDEVTRDLARRMHYAAYRMSQAAHPGKRDAWRSAYFTLRNRIVLGNRKLVYRAVQRWMPAEPWADDMAGDCQIVLIQAVAAYNPWLGIRFSTYAFTCLMRALSRLSQRHASDRLSRSLPLEALPEGEPRDRHGLDSGPASSYGVDAFLREGHSLLSDREKRVLQRRFRLDEQAKAGTLEQVGRELGLSKERVRQVQAAALGKLRQALLEEPAAS